MKTVAWISAGILATAALARAEPPAPPPAIVTGDQTAPQDEPEPRLSPDELREAEARYAREPKAEDVVREALLAAPKPQAEALAARARAAGWVPRLNLRARRGTTVDLSAPQSLDAEALRVRSNDGLTLEASLSFELDRAIFRHEEIALLHQSRAEGEARSRIVREVIKLYFERRRLQLLRDLRDDASLEHRVRLAEIEALLDAFTNGAFRRMIARRWTTGAATPASGSPSPPRSRSTATP